MPPARKVAVVAYMDARLDPARLLGLEEGDAHVIRNAGGVASDDAIRSLALSQRLLGTEEIILMHHSDCGMLTFSVDEVKGQIEADIGIRPPFALQTFADSTTTCVSHRRASRPVRSSRSATRCAAPSISYAGSSQATSPVCSSRSRTRCAVLSLTHSAARSTARRASSADSQMLNETMPPLSSSPIS